jgi:hypothetical protein
MNKTDSRKLIEVFQELGVPWTHMSAEPLASDPGPRGSYMQVCVPGWQFVFDQEGKFLGMHDGRSSEEGEWVPSQG